VTVLIASDLDRTLIYSRDALDQYGDDGGPLVCVERYRDADSSWLTRPAAAGLESLPGLGAVLVPVTTRTPEQLARVTLPGPVPRYAIAANGGVLLVDGTRDAAWDRVVAAGLSDATPFAEVLENARRACLPEWTTALHDAHGLFCYAVLDRANVPDGFVADAALWAEERGWRVSLQGRKLYWVPRSLTKSAALAEVRRRVDADRVLAAGDSLLDADLLLAADEAVAARHGELVESGWTDASVQVTSSCGVRAGEEIVAWFRARLTASSGLTL